MPQWVSGRRILKESSCADTMLSLSFHMGGPVLQEQNWLTVSELPPLQAWVAEAMKIKHLSILQVVQLHRNVKNVHFDCINKY